jgi:ketosteroid isomerase-like protein
MEAEDLSAINRRLQALEDQIAIYQVVCGYGYAVDGCNTEAVASLYAEDGVYAVADMAPFVGRERIAAITQDSGHHGLVNGGCAHMSSLPHIIIDGDRAVATCHTMVLRNGEESFYVFRLSASRLQLSRKPEGGWQIDHRQNYLLDGDKGGPALLARLQEGPKAA